MRLAFLASRKSIHTIKWVNAMAALGHQLHLITMHAGGEPLNSAVRVYRLPVPAPLGYVLNAVHVRAILARIRPDILHVHYATGYGTLGHLSGFHPLLLSVWGSDVYSFPLKSPLHRWLVASNLRAADWVGSTSRVMAKQVQELCPDIANLSVTPFGVDTHEFFPRQYCRTSARLTVGTLKMLAPVCGIDVLLRAFALARQRLMATAPEAAFRMHLLIVGDGPNRHQLESLARELDIDGVTEFAGRVAHHQAADYLRRMDVYVAASRRESFGVAPLEACACGLPLVVSNVGNLPQIVEHGESGYVVETENVSAFSAAILRLVQDPLLRQRMGRAGRQKVLAAYNWTDSVACMERVYTQLLESNASHRRRATPR